MVAGMLAQKRWWRESAMKLGTTQVTATRGGKRHAGLFSVSGSTLIVRVPGMSSRAATVEPGDDLMAVAKQLLEDILNEAEQGYRTA
jgi:hypothetical protein